MSLRAERAQVALLPNDISQTPSGPHSHGRWETESASHSGARNIQVYIHALERGLGLLEEAKHDAFGKFAFFLVIVHFEDLFKRHDVDAVWAIRKPDRSAFGLSSELTIHMILPVHHHRQPTRSSAASALLAMVYGDATIFDQQYLVNNI